MVSEEMIGRRIRQLRVERGMTQEVLAAAAGLTKGYLSKIENSPSSPPVSTLISIARALGVGIDQVFSEQAAETDFTLVRRDERQEIAHRGSSFGYSYQPLALHFPNRHMDPYVMTVPAGAGRTKGFAHKGEEMLYVLKGRQRFFIAISTRASRIPARALMAARSSTSWCSSHRTDRRAKPLQRGSRFHVTA